jgi:hypothetical protein
MVEPGEFKHLPDQAGQATDPEVSAFVSQLLGDRNERSKSHAADVCEIAQVDDEDRKPFGDAGFAVLFKLNGGLGVHAAGNTQDNLVANLCLLNGHNTPRMPYAALRVNLFEPG